MSAHVPSVTAARISRALSDLAQWLSELAEAIEAPTAKLRALADEIDRKCDATRVEQAHVGKLVEIVEGL